MVMETGDLRETVTHPGGQDDPLGTDLGYSISFRALDHRMEQSVPIATEARDRALTQQHLGILLQAGAGIGEEFTGGGGVAPQQAVGVLGGQVALVPRVHHQGGALVAAQPGGGG